MKALFTLTPAESRRLIAKAVAALPEVRHAKEEGRIIIGGGTTNGYVVEELLGVKIDKANYTFGIVSEGMQCSTSGAKREKPIPYTIVRGEVKTDKPYTDYLKEFTKDDVMIKGANAVDPEGNAGVLIGSPVGGTIGAVYNTVFPRNSKLIIAVGLEKLVPSVLDAASYGGLYDWDFCLGMRCALWPVVGAIVITEIEALAILAGVDAVHFSSGGVGGSAGAVTLAIEGEDENVREAFELIKSIKGEPPLADAKRPCAECENHCDRF
ncbi:MAG: hypothetical protein ACOX8W_02525 [bacterium]|jgi:hypothetical protein